MSLAEARQALLERVGSVTGLHRDHDDVGVGDGPRRAGRDAHAGEPLFEHAAAVRVDLGDRELVDVPRSIEQPADECFAHATATEEGKGGHGSEANAPERERARGTIGTVPYFPERDASSCTSGSRTGPTGAGAPTPPGAPSDVDDRIVACPLTRGNRGPGTTARRFGNLRTRGSRQRAEVRPNAIRTSAGTRSRRARTAHRSRGRALRRSGAPVRPAR